MALSNDQLFLDRFVSYNRKRYSQEPDFVATLDALTLNDVSLSNYRRNIDEETGAVEMLVDMRSIPANFSAKDQRYAPADFLADIVSEVVDRTPQTEEQLKEKTVEGVYILQGTGEETSGVILVSFGMRQEAHIQQLIKAGSLYEIADDEISFDENLENATVTSNTIIGKFLIIEANQLQARYDGTHKHDGSIKY